MSELCLSRTTCNFNNINHLLQLIPSFLCSFILSHPLYFSYFLFFSPYLFKFFSFISPLFFVTTLLLLLSTFGFLHTLLPSGSPDEQLSDFEDLEIYKIVFDDPLPFITIGNEEDDDDVVEKQVALIESFATATTTTIAGKTEEEEEEKSLDKLFQVLDKFEDSDSAMANEMKVTLTDETSVKPDKVVGELRKEEPVLVKKVSGSEAEAINSGDYTKKIIQNSGKVGTDDNDHQDHFVECEKSSSWRLDSSSSLGSYGSMRKEKEWKRTLACKLFEERHNAGGEEGMDSLWEAYENDNSKNRKEINSSSSSSSKKKMMVMMKSKKKSNNDWDYEEDEEEEEVSNAQLCCLQALKFSAGKMNLGIGKPNLVKISKALKGFGWLHHHVSSKKHGKKR